MMTHDGIAMGAEGGPTSPLNYKRALIRPPPREFAVEVLPPTKIGNHFSYGIKVSSIIRSRSGSDCRSVSSRSSSYAEYEIWRRWEDCLDFQETLEEEYSKMSHQKRKVLKRGANDKKRGKAGPYALHDAAASFESLPDGPDPREVVVDVHRLIPPLNRKGVLFRVGKTTLKQRGEEFAAMINALFDCSEDAPVLLQDLRNCQPVRDFFGFWRRDQDLLKKNGKEGGRLFHRSQSIASFSTGTFSTTPSSPVSSMHPETPSSPAFPLRHSMFMQTAPSQTSLSSQDPMTSGHRPLPTSAPPDSHKFAFEQPIPRKSSISSDQFLSTSKIDSSGSSILFTDEELLEDDPDSELTPIRRPTIYMYAPRSAPPSSSRDKWPTEPPLTRSSNHNVPYSIPEDGLPRPVPRTRSNSAAVPEYRNARIFVSAPNSPFSLSPEHTQSGSSSKPSHSLHLNQRTADLPSVVSSPSSSHSITASSCASSMSMSRLSISSSVSSYAPSPSKRSSQASRRSCDSGCSLELELPFTDPQLTSHSGFGETQGPGGGRRPRDSASSFASFRTEASAEGVLPRHLHTPTNQQQQQRSKSSDSRSYGSTPLANRPTGRSSIDEVISENGEDLIDSYFNDSTHAFKQSVETLEPRVPRCLVGGHGGNKHSISSISSLSSTGSLVSSSQSSSQDDSFAVKAVYRDSVILFRAERAMSLASVREKIRDRFSQHESVSLEDFVLAYVPSRTSPAPVGAGGGGAAVRRGRSNSAASLTVDALQWRLLRTEVDWQAAATTCGGKISLRILDVGIAI